jgi:signal transduction histidine kinase
MNLQKEMRILIVEDDFMVRETIRQRVENLGYSVISEAIDGRQAVEMTQSLRPAVVLMDIEMPDMDGIEATRRIYESCPTPVIMLTAYDTSELAEQASEAGAGAYLVKMPKAMEIERAITIATARFDDMMKLRLMNTELQAEVAERERAEAALQEYSGRLEEMVAERARELQETQQQLVRQEKLAVLGQMAGGIAHELRTPLGAIKNSAYFLNLVLKEPELKVKDHLAILDREVETCNRIINSLLSFARPQESVRREVDVNDVLQTVLSRLAVPENVKLMRQLDEALPTILAAPDQLELAFGNLALNAVQAMPEGGRLIVKSEVISRDTPSGRMEWVTVSIVDTGIGVPTENLNKLFEPLFTTKAKGIGLGLALVRNIVEDNGGSIEVESPLTLIPGDAKKIGTGEVENGSRFTILLPSG